MDGWDMYVHNWIVTRNNRPPPFTCHYPTPTPINHPNSHVIPFSKLFTDTKERVQCFVSTLAMGAAGYAIYWALGGDWHKIGMMYGVPLLIFNAWITLVTYLQVGVFWGGFKCGIGWTGLGFFASSDRYHPFGRYFTAAPRRGHDRVRGGGVELCQGRAADH